MHTVHNICATKIEDKHLPQYPKIACIRSLHQFVISQLTESELIAQVLQILGPVVRKPINANPRLKINRGFHLAH